MKTVRKAGERGHADHGWLDSHHTFSFGDYYDPQHMGFGVLRVINDDTITGGAGFPKHGHRDMEIISYVLDGGIAHEDSMGTGSVIRPGDVQRMSAGTGVMHSEFNASQTERAHFLQIWIVPAKTSQAPGYEQKFFSDEEKRGKLRLVASPDGADGSVRMGQDARIYASLLSRGETVQHAFADKRKGWLQVARGSVDVDGKQLATGDGLAISDESSIAIGTAGSAEVLLFDLPA